MCVIIIIRTATTFRGIASILDTLRICNVLHLEKTACHTTVRRWINHVGYYNLMKEKEKADDWVYFIDNLIRIENRKVCLILGARLSDLKKGRYLSYEDLETIGIWLFIKNSDIEAMIEHAITLTGVPNQICSDEGPDIMPSIKKIMKKYSGIKHVPDIMHKTGNLLKKKLEKDPRWMKFIGLVTASKRRLCQSSLSCLCPPNLRGKSRFMNCRNVIEWAIRALAALEEMSITDPNWRQMNEKLGWLIDCKQDIALFDELFKLAALAKEVVRKLHIGKISWKIAEDLLEEEVVSDEGKLFTKCIIDFLKVQCEKCNGDVLLVGSSEIIESALSKMKLLDRESGNSGFTLSVLGLAACFGETDYKTVAKAFEECDYKDVEAWGKKYVGETIQKKRKRILKPQKAEDLVSKLTRFIEGSIMVA
jgi:hypothetical protein